MNIQIPDPSTAYSAARRSLRIVLILSAIGSGYMFLSSFIMALSLPLMTQFFSTQIASIPSELQVAIEMALKAPRSYYFLSALLYALSFLGVLLMWRVHRNGFHCYTLAQLLLLIVPVIFLGNEYLSIGDVMITLFFVVYYFMAFRGLSAIEQQLNSLESESEDSSNEEQE